MADTTHTIRIRMDTSGVPQGTQQVQSQLQQVDNAAQRATGNLGAVSKATRGLGAQFASVNAALAASNSALVGLGQSSAVANAALLRSDQTLAHIGRVSEQTVLQLRQMNTALAQLSTAATPAATAATAVAATGAAAQTATARVGLLERAFVSLRTQLLSMNSALVGFSAGFAALGAVRVLANFDDQMADVRAVTLATDADFKKLRDTALDLGATTRFTAAQAAEGLELLARAGADAEGSIALIGPTLKLAQAENLSLADSADYLAKITQGMRLELSEGARVADVLAAAASATAADVRQLGNAFKYAAPIAAGFKIPVEEVAAALGVLANSGLTGDQGGTAIRGILSKIAAPTKEFTKDLKAVGLEISELNPQTNNLVSILEKLQKANVGTSESFDLFKQRAGAGAEILINNIDKVKQLRTELEGARGNLDKKFEIKADTLQADLLSALSAVQSLILALGDAGLTFALRTAAQVFGAFFRGMSETVTALVPLIYNVGVALAVVFSPTILAAFVAGMVQIAPLFAAVAVQATRAAAAVALFALANPFTALAVAAGIAVTVFQKFGREVQLSGSQFATLGDIFDGTLITIKRDATIAFNAVLFAAQNMGKGMVEVFRLTSIEIGDILNGIASKAASVLDVIRDKISGSGFTTFDLLKGGLKALQGGAKSVINSDSGGALSVADDLAQTRAEEALGAALRDTHAQFLKNSQVKQQSAVASRGAAEEEKNLRSGYSRTRDVLDSLFGQQHEALSNMAILNKLFSEGRVSVSEYADQLQKLRGQLLQNDQTLQGGVLKGLNSVAEGATKLGDHIGTAISNGFSAASDAIADFAVTGKLNFSDFTSSILRDMTKLATNAIFGSLVNGLLGSIGGGAIGGGGLLGGGGGLGSLFGFAGGGSARVGGAGGTDSKMVSFRATPGELIDVRTPGQAREGGAGTIINIINNSGAEVRQEKRRGAGGTEIYDLVISAMNQGISSGKVDGSFRGRYGLTPATVRR